MMRTIGWRGPAGRLTRYLLWPVLLGLGAGAGGCSKANTVLLVNVEDASGTLANVSQLKVRVSIGEALSQFFAPAAPGPKITFPTNLSVELDRSHTGSVNLEIFAVNAAGMTLAQSSSRLAAISVGSLNTLTVRLGLTQADGGLDGASDGADGPGDEHPDLAGSGGTSGCPARAAQPAAAVRQPRMARPGRGATPARVGIRARAALATLTRGTMRIPTLRPSDGVELPHWP
jgi:hypothetical protein